jgi:hypothetical protein
VACVCVKISMKFFFFVCVCGLIRTFYLCSQRYMFTRFGAKPNKEHRMRRSSTVRNVHVKICARSAVGITKIFR